MTDPAVFLDRDGTVILDRGYPRDPSQVELVPGAAEALGRLAAAGFRLVLVSNQSGVGRGIVSDSQLVDVHARLVALLDSQGLSLAGAYYCPHAPSDNCDCRKPKPALLLRAASELDLDLERSFMVGDKPSDVEAGRAAGCRAILLPDSDWAAVADRILASPVGE